MQQEFQLGMVQKCPITRTSACDRGLKKTDSLNLEGNIGVGHVRYPTAGRDDASEAQPFYTSIPANISLAHNGTLTNQLK